MRSAPEGLAQRHILTVVLEDYCHVAPVSRVVPSDYWSRFESRVQRNTELTLDLLDRVGAKATFFVLGWIGEHQPQMIAELVRRGHEVASKGFFHRHIRQMTPEQFREDVRRSREALQDASGIAIRGYRAPRGGIAKRDLWALDVLAEEGFAYDSSVRPLGLEFAGEPFRRFIHRHERGGRRIWEVPLSTWSLGPFSLPIAGGNYMRQLPDVLIRQALAAWERNDAAPLVCYFHVWELDPDQPRISAVSALNRLRQYRNLRAMSERIRYYLDQYRFGTISEYLQLPPAPSTLPVDGGKLVGTHGAIGCFSLQQGKHITTGEGGLCVTNDAALARRLRLFVNKAWGYGDPNPDHYFLALNYRLTELQGAVALAQLDKLVGGVEQRRKMAARLSEQINDLPGITTPRCAPGAVHVFWRYCLWVDENEVPGGSPALGAGLKRQGIAAAPRYIQKPAFQCEIFRDQRTFGNSRFPFTLARPEAVDYSPALFPGVFQCLRDVLVLPWNERFTEQHVDFVAAAVRSQHARLRGTR